MYQFKTNKYQDWYQDLVQSAKNQNRVKSNTTYYESHHIVPKCLGGDNSKLNLVLLTAREHYIAHLLLVRMVQDCDVYRMINAIRRFGKKVTNSKEFELIRKTISNYSKGDLNPAFNKIWIHNSVTKEILYVDKYEFENMDHSRFVKGLPYQRGGHRNTIWVNNKIEEICVSKDNLILYLNSGWCKGRLNPATIEHMRHMANNRHTPEKDKEHSQKLTGRIAVKHLITGKIKKILPTDLEKYMHLGYTANADFKRDTLCYKLLIEGIEYNSLYQAAIALNLHKNTIFYRVKSKIPKWSNWIKLP